jgi:Flp pilus assembly protein TadD
LPRELQKQPRATYLRAEAYRIVADYPAARSLYRDLSKGCLAGAGYHGLGLIDAAEHDVGGAVQHLYEARMRLSADPRVRNDYGYALLLAGRTAEAKVEFETGAELSNRQPKVIRNLVLTLLVEGDSEGALRYARSIAVSEADLDRLYQRATEIRKQLAKDTSDEKIR